MRLRVEDLEFLKGFGLCLLVASEKESYTPMRRSEAIWKCHATCIQNPKGPRAQIIDYNINASWALKPYSLGPWTLGGTLDLSTQLLQS